MTETMLGSEDSSIKGISEGGVLAVKKDAQGNPVPGSAGLVNAAKRQNFQAIDNREKHAEATRRIQAMFMQQQQQQVEQPKGMELGAGTGVYLMNRVAQAAASWPGADADLPAQENTLELNEAA